MSARNDGAGPMARKEYAIYHPRYEKLIDVGIKTDQIE